MSYIISFCCKIFFSTLKLRLRFPLGLWINFRPPMDFPVVGELLTPRKIKLDIIINVGKFSYRV
jgi:hypothetical protein